jgi:hypothetical protein
VEIRFRSAKGGVSALPRSFKVKNTARMPQVASFDVPRIRRPSVCCACMPTGLSYRLIARNVGMSKNTVMNFVRRSVGR